MRNLQEVLRIPDAQVKTHPLKYLSYEPGPTKLVNLDKKALIACTARSGSSFVSVALRKYSLNFGEFLNTEGSVFNATEKYGIATTKEYGDHLAETAISAGVLGLKIPFVGMAYLAMFGEFPAEIRRWRVVFLRRRNLVRQAISMLIASKTQQWTAVMPANAQISDADYDFERLKRSIEFICGENEKWERLFALYQIEPYRVYYEDFVDNEERILKEIVDFVGADPSRVNPDFHQFLTVQSTELNDIWENRFAKDARDYGQEIRF